MLYLNKINKILLSACTFLLFSCSQSFDVYADGHLEEISKTAGDVSVKMIVSKLSNNKNCKAKKSWRWGTERICPKNIVDRLEVKYKGKNVFVSLSAFSDLSNVRNLDIEYDKKETSSEYFVILSGGDAAFSYTAKLKFKGVTLQEKLVRHGEFPDKAWEKTIYGYNL